MTATPNSLTTTRTFEWTQTNWLPTPRHRNPQTRVLECTTEVTVPVIDRFDAPVAYVVATEEWDESHRLVPGEPKVYRVHNGRLYTIATTNYAREKPGPIEATEQWLATASLPDQWDLSVDTEDEAIAKVVGRFSRYIIVDGLVWMPASEPAYEVKMPAGFYRREGDPVRIEVVSAPHAEQRPADTRFFPADQYEQAVAYARARAEAEHASAEQLPTTPPIDVTGEHHPGANWRPAPRLSYPPLDSVSWDAHVDEWQAVMRAFRASIATTLPELLRHHDDGFGNNYITVDTSGLSEDQESDYNRLLDNTGDPTAGKR